MKETLKQIMLSGNGMRVLFGFALLFMIGTLAAIIALGKVEQATSHGLDMILGAFTTLSGGFATWAFGQQKNGNGQPPTNPS